MRTLRGYTTETSQKILKIWRVCVNINYTFISSFTWVYGIQTLRWVYILWLCCTTAWSYDSGPPRGMHLGQFTPDLWLLIGPKTMIQWIKSWSQCQPTLFRWPQVLLVPWPPPNTVWPWGTLTNKTSLERVFSWPKCYAGKSHSVNNCQLNTIGLIRV
jgi:hypothetical protein